MDIAETRASGEKFANNEQCPLRRQNLGCQCYRTELSIFAFHRRRPASAQIFREDMLDRKPADVWSRKLTRFLAVCGSCCPHGPRDPSPLFRESDDGLSYLAVFVLDY